MYINQSDTINWAGRPGIFLSKLIPTACSWLETC